MNDPEHFDVPFDWMPLDFGGVKIVGWDGASYIDTDARGYWSGAATPSADDCRDAVANRRQTPAPVPEVLSRVRFIIALRKVLGLSEGHIHAILSTLPKGDAQEDARDRWEHSLEFRRHDPLLVALASRDGITKAQLDEVFRVGAALPF